MTKAGSTRCFITANTARQLPNIGAEAMLFTFLNVREDAMELFGFASKKYHPVDDFDAKKWKNLHLRTRYYTTKLHIGSFYLPAYLEEMLEEVEKENCCK